MTTAEKKSFLVRYPVLSYYLMSCAFFWTLLVLFGAIVVGVLQVDPNTQPWTVWIVTIWARGCPPCRRPSSSGLHRALKL